MEEFRAPVVDAVALTLLREERIVGLDFEHDADADLPCRLGTRARKTFVEALENKLESHFIHPRLKRAVDFRRAMQAQARHYVRVLRRQDLTYVPLKQK
jgi:CRISP-associated protein Cas1